MNKSQGNRCIIVSNRLPVSYAKDNRGKIVPVEGAGGLVSGLKSYLNAIKKEDYLWIGCPGTTFDNEKDRKEVAKQAASVKGVPVFVDDVTYSGFYNGFCNSTIYPLFHYFTNYVHYDDWSWDRYVKVNEKFRDVILKTAKPGDTVWVHDYQLMLLPAMVRATGLDVKIGFFLHIPFPSYEIFRQLPAAWSKELLKGTLGADLIGFHTYDYMQDFLTCVSRLLGYESNMGYLDCNDGRIKRVDTFPMGIDFHKFQSRAQKASVIEERKNIQKNFGKLKIIFSVDRLDYTKGILNRLEGYQLFLEKNPQFRGKVVLVLIAVPSRDGIQEYRSMKVAIDEKVGFINGRFGTIGWSPVLYQNRFIGTDSLVALYDAAYAALITPLRDGMNLVAKEYVASKMNSSGVLILSDMAGSAKELGDAVIVNPYHPEEICKAIEKAMDMGEEEKLSRLKAMQERVKSYDIVRWGNDFLEKLEDVGKVQEVFNAKLLGRNENSVVSKYTKAEKALILLDYDGTLMPFVNDPSKASPSVHVMELLKKLSSSKKNSVVVISGRDKGTLGKWLGSTGASLVAEHGVMVRERKASWKSLQPQASRWKSRIMPILKDYADRLPGSHIEEKEFSLVWHYRNAESEFASLRVQELFDNLGRFTSNANIRVYKGNKIIEIRNSGFGKGAAAMHFVRKVNPDFILAIGDDYTDEDMFRQLPDSAYTIRVGMNQSYARYNLHDSEEVLRLLGRLADKN